VLVRHVLVLHEQQQTVDTNGLVLLGQLDTTLGSPTRIMFLESR